MDPFEYEALCKGIQDAETVEDLKLVMQAIIDQINYEARKNEN